METMDDFKDELEASFRQIREGDIIKGTVIAVSEEEITLDLKYYAQGITSVVLILLKPHENILFRCENSLKISIAHLFPP